MFIVSASGKDVYLAVGLVRQHGGVHGERADLIDGDLAPQLAGLVRRALDERHVRMDAGERALEHLCGSGGKRGRLRAAAL